MSFRQNNESKIEWKRWIFENQNTLIECGIPELYYQSETHWCDFLEHGYLDHHQDFSNFSIDKLSLEQKRCLADFLENNLENKDKNSTIALQILKSQIAN